jgi:predicted  nucleic acid-binding Zn-ribbon protein
MEVVPVSRNPLESQLDGLTAALEALCAQRDEVTSALEWYSSFDSAAARQKAGQLQAKLRQITDNLADTTSELTTARQQTSTLEAKTKWGRDPRYWFSQERTRARTRLERHGRKLKELKTRRAELSEKADRTRRKLKKCQRAISRHESFDPAGANATLAALDADIPVREAERADLVDRKERLDRQLEGAVESLTELEHELKNASSRRSSLRSAVERCERDIAKAKRLDKALTDAYDGSERYQVHQESEDEFGDGSPRRVLGDRRRKLNEARKELSTLERRIPGIERNVAKAKERVATIVTRGTRDVRAIVIDGNNLCYAGEKFIGTAALRPLCVRLSKNYDVTVVFDNSIRRLLSGSDNEKNWLSEEDVRTRCPGATVHVVAARTQADETILATAVGPSVYVLSNDRFAEFRDKPPVREKRLLTHEILDKQVFVHDLDISLTFTPGP